MYIEYYSHFKVNTSQWRIVRNFIGWCVFFVLWLCKCWHPPIDVFLVTHRHNFDPQKRPENTGDFEAGRLWRSEGTDGDVP